MTRTITRAAFPVSSIVLLTTAAVSAVALGMAVSSIGPPILLVIPVAVGGLAILAQPFLGILAAIAIIPLDAAAMVPGGVTVTKLLLVVVGGAWVANKVIRHEPWGPILYAGYAVVGALFIGEAAASTLWATYLLGVNAQLARLVMFFGLSLLVLDLTRTWEQAAHLARALVLGGLAAAAMTVGEYVIGHARRAGGGVAGGVNDTASMLVALVPLAFVLVRAQRSGVWRLLGLTYIGLATVAVATTFSRMNFLLLPCLLLVELWPLARGSRRSRTLLFALAACLVASLNYLPWDQVRERIGTIGSYIDATFEYGSEQSTETTQSSRGYHLRVAYEVFKDHPFFGVGYSNFGFFFRDEYQYDVLGAHKLWSSVRSAHSSHMAILADLGIAGFVLWMLLLYAVFRALWRARPPRMMRAYSLQALLLRAALISLVLQFVYAFYGEVHKDKLFWVVLGLGVAVARLGEAADHSAATLTESHPGSQRPASPAPAVLA